MDGMNNNYNQQQTGYTASNGFAQPQNGFAGQPQGGYAAPNSYPGADEYSDTANGAQGFVPQEAYQQQTYQNTYTSPAGYTTNYTNNTYGNMYSEGGMTPVKCPGKEITGMIFGISSILMGLVTIIMGIVGIAVGAAFGRHSIYGSYYRTVGASSSQVFVYGFIYGIMAIAFSVVAIVLRNKVMLQATETTNKIKAGFGMAIAGLIMGGLGLFLTIIALITMFA